MMMMKLLTLALLCGAGTAMLRADRRFGMAQIDSMSSIRGNDKDAPNIAKMLQAANDNQVILKCDTTSAWNTYKPSNHQMKVAIRARSVAPHAQLSARHTQWLGGCMG